MVDGTPASRAVTVLGAGQMAEALINGMVNAKVIHSEAIWATDRSRARCALMKERYGIRVTTDNREAVKWGTVILLAVKPQVLAEVLEEIGPDCSGKLIVSVAAGMSLTWLAHRLPNDVRLFRVMPNAPALIGEGMSVIACGEGAQERERQFVRELFEAVGQVIFLAEQYMDVVTGLSGSGPAYAFLALDALADGGVKMGLSRDQACRFAAQTMEGTARMVREEYDGSRILPGAGTALDAVTHAGLDELKVGHIRETLVSAVGAATRRSKVLGRSCL